ncbi:ABC transporter substrate-binding protein [Actinomyces sp. MRS3W]|uniref:ABC transporter substrate-binding protein n=1 Tax=Actinomyces sp. MRS3W TaxID=2800796 RepID=UPI0028FD09A8|nr:ABC transporter substrate-binding protein [Actinomyces sp. MRS3W]MDU0348747.1 ABC transporter substrate-binding protein [Actinomyces sp. MRS3W]
MVTIDRRRFLGLAASTAVMTTLAACGGGGSQSSSTGEGGTTTLKLWHGYTEADGKVLDSIVEAFNASQDTYKVEAEVTAWSSISEKLLTSLSAGDGPDIVCQGVDTGPGYAKQGAFIPLQDFYDDPETYTSSSVYYSNVVEQVTWDGATYAVPMGVSAFAVWYNTAMWEAAGLTEADYPTTVDELIEVAKKLTIASDDGGAPKQYGLALPDSDAGVLSTLLHSGGGDFISDGEVLIDSPENIATLTTWQKAFTEDHISPVGMDVNAAAQLFQGGKAAMILNGPWQITAAATSGVEVGLFPWPGDWVESVAMYWYATSMVNTEEKTKAAYAFMDFWNSHEQQVAWTASYYPPNRSDITADEFSDPLVATLSTFSDQAHYYMTGVDTSVTDITNETSSMMSKIAAGGDVAALVAECQTKVEGYMAS